MHQITVEVSCHSHPLARPATRERLGKHAWLRERTAAKKEGGSAVRGTQESDRTSSPTPAEIKICSRAVLHGSSYTKHQAISPLPPPRNRTDVGYNIVATSLEKQSSQLEYSRPRQHSFPTCLFQHPRLFTTVALRDQNEVRQTTVHAGTVVV